MVAYYLYLAQHLQVHVFAHRVITAQTVHFARKVVGVLVALQHPSMLVRFTGTLRQALGQLKIATAQLVSVLEHLLCCGSLPCLQVPNHCTLL